MVLEDFLIQTYLSLKCTNYKIWAPSKRSKAGEKSIVLVCFLRISSWKVHKNQLFYFLHIFWSIHFCRSILEYLWFLLASYASNNHQKHFGSQPLVLNVFLPFSPLQYRPNKPTFLLSKPLIHSCFSSPSCSFKKECAGKGNFFHSISVRGSFPIMFIFQGQVPLPLPCYDFTSVTLHRVEQSSKKCWYIRFKGLRSLMLLLKRKSF